MEAITIRPANAGDWTLERAGGHNLRHFRNAKSAVDAASQLAERFADLGRFSTIVLCKPDGAPASRFVAVLR